jgi:ubiquinone biosynthesis protein
LMDTLDPYYGATLKQINVGNLIRNCSRLLVRYRMKLPTSYTLMLKSLVTIEGMGKKLDPEFDITALARPFVEQLIVQRWKPKRLAHDLELAALDLSSLIKRVPQQVVGILNRIQHGSLDLQFNHKGLNPMMQTLDKVSNRIAFAMVIAALLVSSALIMTATSGTAFGRFAFVGVSGYVVAGVLGLWLAFSILRSGGL